MNAATLRERLLDETRSTIRAVALQLFLEQGFDETSAQDIATRAGVSVATFFRHFPRKVDVVFHGAHGAAARFGAMLASLPPTDDPLATAKDALVRAQLAASSDERERQVARLIEAAPALRAEATLVSRELEVAVATYLGTRGVDAVDAQAAAAALFAALRVGRATVLAHGGDVAATLQRVMGVVQLPAAPRAARSRSSRRKDTRR